MELLIECKNHLKNNPMINIKKNKKNQSQIAASEQKNTSDKANFCSNTVFSFFEVRVTKFDATRPLSFLFRRDQKHHFKRYENF